MALCLIDLIMKISTLEMGSGKLVHYLPASIRPQVKNDGAARLNRNLIADMRADAVGKISVVLKELFNIFHIQFSVLGPEQLHHAAFTDKSARRIDPNAQMFQFRRTNMIGI